MNGFPHANPNSQYRETMVMDLMRAAFKAAESATIERCAKVLEETWFKSQSDCIAAIRALSDQEKGDGA